VMFLVVGITTQFDLSTNCLAVEISFVLDKF
jgi:hypothetical protein